MYKSLVLESLSCLLPPVSCLLPLASCVSCLLPLASCLLPLASLSPCLLHLASCVLCPVSPASCLLPLASSLFMVLASCLLSPASWFMFLNILIKDDNTKFYCFVVIFSFFLKVNIIFCTFVSFVFTELKLSALIKPLRFAIIS